MSHPIPSQEYPCEYCGHQFDDCICEDVENGIARRLADLPDDDYYRDQEDNYRDLDEDYIPFNWL